MAWFFTTILVLGAQPPISDHKGPYKTQQDCQIIRLEMLGRVPELKATDCLQERVLRVQKKLEKHPAE
jgi:hypothetical protein